jgi:L-ascorbate metabolism protein UlaG (beta-lactamase superfamily)
MTETGEKTSSEPSPGRSADPRRFSRRRLLLWAGGGLPLAGGLVGFLTSRRFSAPRHQGSRLSHFDGRRFHNQAEGTEKSFGDFLRWQLHREKADWRFRDDLQPGPAPPKSVFGDRLRVTFVNHSTVLLQVGGLNLLTDPIWSDRCSPVGWAGPRRAHPPGIRFAELPPIHAVLISHNHYDHLDVPTLRRLARDHRPAFFAGLGNRRLLASNHILQARDLDWWQGVDLRPGFRVTCVPAQHWSGRSQFDRNGTLWCGYALETPAGVVYFAGDTGFGPHFEDVRRRFGSPRLALLPIGAYLPRWFMGSNHMSPDDAVEAHHVLHAEQSRAIHFGTFQLGDDGQDEAVLELAGALSRAGVSDARFRALQPGESEDL